MRSSLLSRSLIALSLLIIIALYMPAFVTPTQPVVLFYIEDGRTSEAQLRMIARNLTAKYKMGFHLECDSYKECDGKYNGTEENYTIFAATNNGWLYRLALVAGSEPQFNVEYASPKIAIIVTGAPDHPRVHSLVADWTAALDAAKIKYKAEVRTPLQPPV